MNRKQTETATVSTTSTAPVDVTSAKFKANSFPYYVQLRAEAPVFPVTQPWQKFPRRRTWPASLPNTSPTRPRRGSRPCRRALYYPNGAH